MSVNIFQSPMTIHVAAVPGMGIAIVILTERLKIASRHSLDRYLDR